jgi:hypothetical protein
MDTFVLSANFSIHTFVGHDYQSGGGVNTFVLVTTKVLKLNTKVLRPNTKVLVSNTKVMS